MIGPRTTRAELAAVVAEALRQRGIELLLVGGSVVALYSGDRYVTQDLDFVSDAALKDVKEALAPLGFSFRGRLGSHPDTDFTLDFVAPPASVGSKPIVETAGHRTRAGTFRSLTPTDCVLDRLAAYYFWDDEQAFEQAVLVARRRRVDLTEVRRWTKSEEAAAGRAGQYAAKLERYAKRVAARRRKRKK